MASSSKADIPVVLQACVSANGREIHIRATLQVHSFSIDSRQAAIEPIYGSRYTGAHRHATWFQAELPFLGHRHITNNCLQLLTIRYPLPVPILLLIALYLLPTIGLGPRGQ